MQSIRGSTIALLLVSAGSTTAADDQGHGGEPSAGLIHYVAIMSAGPEWVDGVPVSGQREYARHHAYMMSLRDRGRLVIGGPFTDQTGGGISIVQAADLDEARRLVTDDPWVSAGVLRLWCLRPWLMSPVDAEAASQVERHSRGQRSVDPSVARVLSKEVTVRASLDDVWRCWTTPEGIASFFSSESRVELRVGGPYELYMGMAKPDATGKRGTEGCRVLSYLPKEMISFEWNFPPKVPTLRMSGVKTHVVLRFTDLGDGQVRVRLDQLGWGRGVDWDQGYAYFDRAWDLVLGRLEGLFGEGRGPRS